MDRKQGKIYKQIIIIGSIKKNIARTKKKKENGKKDNLGDRVVLNNWCSWIQKGLQVGVGL